MENKNELGVVSQQKDYKVEAKYSEDAINKKLVRFTLKGSRKSFEISADELIAILAHQVNQDVLAPTFVDTQRVNVVNVSRQLKAVLKEDMKAGTEIRMTYTHPYPIEFALIEEAMNIAKVEGTQMSILTKEFIDAVRLRISPRMEEFVQKFYDSFKQFNKQKEASPPQK